MRFIIDESVERQVAQILREAGYDVLFVPEVSPSASDEDILSWSNRDARVIITADKDFGELIFRQRCVGSGIVLLRLHGIPNDQKAQLVMMVVNSFSEDIQGSFCVIEPTRLRIRPLTD